MHRSSGKWAALVLLAAVACLLAPVAGQAALVNSNHDMIIRNNLSGAQARGGACSFCHIPHGAATAKLFPPFTDNLASGLTDWASDPNAIMCWQCHGAASSWTYAVQVNPFQNLGNGVHGRNYQKLVTWGDVASAAAFTGLAIPYTNTTDNTISCASCHNPHENGARPFIREVGASTYGANEGNFALWCTGCHVARGQNANSGTRVNHPFNDNIASGANSSITAFASIGANFRSPLATLTVTISGTTNAAGAVGTAWNLGGHAYSPTGSNIMTCATCHAVHSNETAANWGTDDGPTATSTAVANANNMLAVYGTEPGVGAVAAICSNCHDLTNATRGPGASGVSHQYQKTNWTVSIADVRGTPWFAKFGGVWGTPASQTLACQSCHDVHFARLNGGGSTLPSSQWALMRVSCDECHSPSTKTGHHPSGSAVVCDTATGTTPAIFCDGDATGVYGPFISTAMNWATIDNDHKVMTNATGRGNRTAGTSRYSLATGRVMTCGTCHGSGSGGKAHNDTTFPGLAGTIAQDEMCVDCHGTNPSEGTIAYATGSPAKTLRMGTHMVGVPSVGANTSTIYRWNYGASTAVTPAGGIAPAYGTGAAANGALICRSCHTLKITGYTPQFSFNTPAKAMVHDNVGLLLTPSGNSQRDVVGTTNDFLCTACHGATPGGNFSHATQPTFDNAMSAAIQTRVNASTLVTLVPVNNGINCESCHRPHNAATYGRNYALEDAGTGNATYVQEEVLCNICHVK